MRTQVFYSPREVTVRFGLKGLGEHSVKISIFTTFFGWGVGERGPAALRQILLVQFTRWNIALFQF